ncbi:MULTISPECIES: insecticidal delta-endotoxin Cry8Ea1 family protein [Pantoea]|uniref:Pesticidal crystal protein domain-containing protein n=1 Tax=Candidatus Pantoea gossypiicola TaxID=2608008 RepID=A0AB34CE50_9GAMM|nr:MULTISPECIES: insecticidal delta-endotoxin Cry8Ea1 family protein [Pantoea]KAA5922128.1 hypothetical protein F3I59_22445 [Pantoea sp. VH_8]KAA5930006.1 hypothetical protein F3I58_19770 [Pantoea sp. VH_4]KAA5951251.1 hypothetical protein F3I55_20330 [Pantoea sp. VH_24]KAA5953262.1 hypothetical protein F3I53_22745 [Pantoea sp. VH_16]KAA5959065.1 hypothetical protein F3I54_22955 [Pantoea sp. VH_18]
MTIIDTSLRIAVCVYRIVLSFHKEDIMMSVSKLKTADIDKQNILISNYLSDSGLSDNELTILKTILGKAATYFVPELGGLINAVLNLFWPSGEDTFTKIKAQIEALVNEKIDQSTWSNLQAIISELHTKMSYFKQYIDKQNFEMARDIYTALSPWLLGIDERFKVDGMSKKYYFVPLYVMVVDIIYSFRIECIVHAVTIGLTDNEVSSERKYISDLLSDNNSGAINYLSAQKDNLAADSKQQVSQCSYYGQYNQICSTFNYFQNAFDHIFIYQEISKNPEKPEKAYIPSCYPGFFSGVSTNEQSFESAWELAFKPQKAGDKISPISHLGFASKIYSDPMTGGLTYYASGIKVDYENGNSWKEGVYDGNYISVSEMDLSRSNYCAKVSARTYLNVMAPAEYLQTFSALNHGGTKKISAGNMDANYYNEVAFDGKDNFSLNVIKVVSNNDGTLSSISTGFVWNH